VNSQANRVSPIVISPAVHGRDVTQHPEELATWPGIGRAFSRDRWGLLGRWGLQGRGGLGLRSPERQPKPGPHV